MKTLCEDLQGCEKTRLTSQQTVYSSRVSVALVASWEAPCSECKALWATLTHFRVWHPQLPTLGVLPGDFAHCVFLPLLLGVLSHPACYPCLLHIPLKRDDGLGHHGMKEHYS